GNQDDLRLSITLYPKQLLLQVLMMLLTRSFRLSFTRVREQQPPDDSLKTAHLAPELEFVQIIIILLVMTFMIVVIICLLNHYRLSALAFLSRLSHTQENQAAQQVGAMTTQPNHKLMTSQIDHECFSFGSP
ncbi:unnamed protein product, partial [Lampetra planeri]